MCNIVGKCDLYPFSQIYNTLYNFAYLGFLRISNIVPPSKKNFDLSKNLCRGDILVNKTNVVVIIKWSKTLQNSSQGSYIVLQRLKSRLLCPAFNFIRMSSLYPSLPNLPCFATPFFTVTKSTHI